MNYLILLLTPLLPSVVFAQAGQTYYEYVWARSGLVLRAEPGKQAAKMKTLAYGTPVVPLWHGNYDSVMIYPARQPSEDDSGEPFYLHGYWVKVATGVDTGYLFGGYLSNMPPFKPPAPTEQGPSYTIESWILQQATVLDTRQQPNDNDDYSTVYSNHVIKRVKISEGGGTERYIFPRDRRFEDGFLLLSYFVGIDVTKKQLDACNWWRLDLRPNYIFFESEGLNGGIYFMFRISFDGETLVVESGGGC
ncbi:MAG: SH3 domain-containing protein [Saprospiraceae bacterium]